MCQGVVRRWPQVVKIYQVQMVKDLAQSNHLLKSYGQKTTENQKFLDTDKNCRLSEVFCHNVLTNDWIVLKRSPLVVYFQHHYFKI